MKKFDKLSQSSLIIIIGVITMSALIFSLNGSNERFARSAALETARSYSETFTSIRSFYQKNVVERLQGTNASIVHNFREVEGAVPIPATMMIELTAYLNQANNDITVALVSDYPFPWRSNRPLVDFDIKALEFFRESNSDEFYDFRIENDTTYVHYARPVVMESGCVACHNNHPDSPKKDWKVGDVRAVQIFELPFDNSASKLSFETAIFASVIIVLSVSAIFALLASNLRSQRAQTRLETEAHFDSLTGALRRPRFQELYDHKSRDKTYVLAIIDIDDFKSFNTDFGHAAGDQILADVARKIKELAFGATAICRFGGEEFLLLLDHSAIAGDYKSFFEDIVASISVNPFYINDRQVHVTISVGYILLEPNTSFTKCSERADAALRYAKRNGKNKAVEADGDLLRSLGYLDQNYRASDLEHALACGQMFFDFEPIVNLRDRSVVSFEALIRMKNSDNTVVPPSSFLPQYMSALRNNKNSEYFLKMLLQSIENNHVMLGGVRKISFNLDPYDLVNNLEDNCLILALKELTRKGYTVIIEIVETSYMDTISELNFVNNLNYLKELGFSIYMDDFGKAGSSLQRFLSFSFDAVKIDRSILIDLHKSEKAKSLILVLLEMSERSHFDIIVEGVETEEQERMLIELGVKAAQGYLYSRPPKAVKQN